MGKAKKRVYRNQSEDARILFYLNALYELASEISRQKDVEEILRNVLNIIIGTFGIKKGIALVSYTNQPFEILSHQNLDSTEIQKISQNLANSMDDLKDLKGLSIISPKVDIKSPTKRSPELSKIVTISKLMANMEMKVAIPFRIRDRLTVYIGLGSLLSGVSLSEPQIEMLKAVTTQTEIALGNALFYQDIFQENQRLKEVIQEQHQFDNMVGQSSRMLEIYQCVKQVAKYPNYSVLISGESGTGKELVARAIHYQSPRKDKIFLPINCMALPQELVESELFGYEKGAFTGAESAKAGLFEIANGGTIFLDEVAEMPTAIQAKLLRVMDQKEILRVGGKENRPVDVRIIAATNKELKKAISEEQMRSDLYYRFDYRIHIPPLRDRKEDIPLLVDKFLNDIAEENQQSTKALSVGGLRVLMSYDWPGNVRELRKVLMQAVMVSNGKVIKPNDILIVQDDLQPAIQTGSSLRDSLEKFKRNTIEKALSDCSGNKTKAAKQLGISRQNLRNMLQRMYAK